MGKRKRWAVSIQSTMLVAFSLITLSVIATSMFLASRYTMQEVQNVSIDYMDQLITQVNTDIDRYVTYMQDVSEVVGSNATVLRWLNESDEMGDAERLVLQDSVIRQMAGIINTRKDITNIAVFTVGGSTVFDARGKVLNPYIDYTQADWYTEAVQRGGRTYISTSHVQNVVAGRYNWVVSISRAITTGSGEVLGVLLVDLNYSLINDLCEGIDMGNRGYLFLADSEGNIIFHPQQQLIYSHIKSESVQAVLHSNTQVMVDSPEGAKLYISNHSKLTGWTVVGVAYKDEILRHRNEIVQFYVLIFVVFFGAAILLSAAISAGISRPLKKLNTSMQEVQSGRLDKQIDIRTPLEVAQLGSTFNAMLRRLESLMQQREKDQEQKRESELKALQAQINPHFLYNTLDSIIWMAESGHNEEVVEMTAALARLFRSSISESREMVPLSVEVANVRSYLTIQQMRYKEKLQFSIAIAPGVESYVLPKLILQPLVENAIYHGIKPRSAEGQIEVRAYAEGKNMVLEVRDNGVGMDKQKLSNIFTAGAADGNSGIGVNNVQERLKLIYGEAYGLTYESAQGAGTVVRVRLPAEEGLA